MDFSWLTLTGAKLISTLPLPLGRRLKIGGAWGLFVAKAEIAFEKLIGWRPR